MIIFSASLLSGAYPSLDFCRIGWQTWLRDLLPSAITVSSETAEGPRDAPLRPDTAEYWMPAAMPATWKADLGVPRDVDYAGIAGHSIGSSGATVLVETSLDDVTYVPLAYASMPVDDAPIMRLDVTRLARYVRVTLTGTTAPRIATIYAGVALAMPRDMTASGFTPLSLSRQTVLHQSLSRGGQFLGQGFRRMGVYGSIAFKYLDPEWLREFFEPFVKEARRFPYFIAWWPLRYPGEVAYVWTDKDIVPGYMGFVDTQMQALMDVSWQMQGIGNE